MTELALVSDRPDTSELDQNANALVAQARAIVIIDETTYREAADFLKSGVKALEKKIVDFFAPHKRRAKEAHDELCRSERAQLEPVREAERLAKNAIQAYFDECERQRIEEERRRKAEALRLEEERQIQEAIDLEAEGDVAAANAVLAAPVPPPPPVKVEPIAPKVAGIAQREVWTGEIVDEVALIGFVAANWTHFRDLVNWNQSAINARARSMKDALAIPGIRAVSSKSIAAGSR